MSSDVKPMSETANAVAAEAASASQSTDDAKAAGKSTAPPVRVSYAADFASHTLYADGVHSVGLRAGVARIDLYQTVLPANPKQGQPEQRVVTHRLTFPLTVFSELNRMMIGIQDALQVAAKETGGIRSERK